MALLFTWQQSLSSNQKIADNSLPYSQSLAIKFRVMKENSALYYEDMDNKEKNIS